MMEDSKSVANLGTPLGGDLGAIERELAAFWNAASQRPDEAAPIRAVSCNLIVVARNQREAESLPPVLARVAEWHPCRSLVAFQQLEQSGVNLPPMQGWIRVQCTPQFGGRLQICSEMITVAVSPAAAESLPNTLTSLLVPDLPVFLYWRSPGVADRNLVKSLARFAHLLVIDSQALFRDPVNPLYLSELLDHAPERAELRDLNWPRLTAWRDLIAQFFDTRATRTHLKEFAEVEIRCAFSHENATPIALLLAGWLASRLGWQWASAEKRPGQWTSRWRRAGGEVLVRFTSTSADSARLGIKAVRLTTHSGGSFSVVENEEKDCMYAVADEGTSRPVVHTIARPSASETDLLISELSQLGEDTGFQAARAAALELEKGFR
jgi:glucose-6-phosphate dehydrogenase assembly protein OpcA